MSTGIGLALAALLSIFSPEAQAHSEHHHDRGHGYSHQTSSRLVIENDRRETVRVFADNEMLGLVGSDATATFDIRHGRQLITVRDLSGRLLESESILGTSGHSSVVEVEADFGRLVLANDAGVPLEVRVDGKSQGLLAVGARRTLTLEPGAVRVEATFQQLGKERRLSEETVRIDDDAIRTIRFEPMATGLVRVENRLGRTADVFVDGADFGRVEAGASRELVVPLGTVRIDMRVRGELLATTRIEVRPFDDLSWRADQAVLATLVLQNRDDHSARVFIDGEERVSLAGWQTLDLQLLPGTHEVVVRNAHGDAILRRTVSLRGSEVEELSFGERERQAAWGVSVDWPHTSVWVSL